MSYDIVEPYAYTDSAESLARTVALPVDPEVAKIRQAIQALTPKGPGLAKCKVPSSHRVPRTARPSVAPHVLRTAKAWRAKGLQGWVLVDGKPRGVAFCEVGEGERVYALNTASGLEALERALVG